MGNPTSDPSNDPPKAKSWWEDIGEKITGFLSEHKESAIGGVIGGILGMFMGPIGGLIGMALGLLLGEMAKTMMRIGSGGGFSLAEAIGDKKIDKKEYQQVLAQHKGAGDKQQTSEQTTILKQLEEGKAVILTPKANDTNLGPVIYAKQDANGVLSDIQVAINNEFIRVAVTPGHEPKVADAPDMIIAAQAQIEQKAHILNPTDTNVLIDDVVSQLTPPSSSAATQGQRR